MFLHRSNRTTLESIFELVSWYIFFKKNYCVRLLLVVVNSVPKWNGVIICSLFFHSIKFFLGLDLPTDMERYLAEEVFKKPVFVYNYPKDIKGKKEMKIRKRSNLFWTFFSAFYMRLNDDGKTVAAYDLLVFSNQSILQLTHIWIFLNRCQVLASWLADRNVKNASINSPTGTKCRCGVNVLWWFVVSMYCSLKELKLDVDAYWWYLDLRRYIYIYISKFTLTLRDTKCNCNRFGTVPHAGFGLGFERLIMLCTGSSSLRLCLFG